MERFDLDDAQAQAIVDMKLGQLAGLERDKIESEYKELIEKITDLEDILANSWRVDAIIKEDLTEIKRKYSDARRTEIGVGEVGLEDEDLIPVTDCVFTLTDAGYVKRIQTSEYRAQHRGGVGVKGVKTKEHDTVKQMFVASSHDYILFFTNLGRVYKIKGYEVPESSRTAKGTSAVNLIPLMSGERVSSMIRVADFNGEDYLMMVTRGGVVKKTSMAEYANIRKTGVIAIIIDEEDTLDTVLRTSGDDNIIIASHYGKAIKFNETDVRPMGRVTRGVRGIKLEGDDYVVGAVIEQEDSSLLTVTENGYGKRTETEEYRVQTRGGKGVGNYNITEKTGNVCAIAITTGNEDLLLVTSGGQVMRTAVDEISTFSRTTKGVRIVKLPEGIKVIDISLSEKEEESAPEEETTEEQVTE